MMQQSAQLSQQLLVSKKKEALVTLTKTWVTELTQMASSLGWTGAYTVLI